jgi:DNA-3-methyladenine glycosylase
VSPADPASARSAAPAPTGGAGPLPAAFYDRPVLEVAPALVGCVVRHGDTAGVIVETEAYHHSEAACHAYVGLTARTRPLFGPAGVAYVYRSYGIHALLNAVCEPEGVGAAVLIRALAPLDGLEVMRARRRVARDAELCSGPGKLTQALSIGLDLNGTSLLGDGPITLDPRPVDRTAPNVLTGTRIGITKAADLPWRFAAADSPYVSHPRLRRAA